LKPLDLGKLQERLASVEEEAKANDPRALKAEVARLQRELAEKARGGLKSAALIEYPSAGEISLSEAGAEKAEAPDAAPNGDELRRRILAKLSGPQSRILDTLIRAYPEDLDNEQTALRSDYSDSSSSYEKARGSLRTLNLIGYPSVGRLRAQDWLFP
jgi:hypothetical protein